MTNCHQLLDERALAMDRLIAKKIREHPESIDKVRATLARWLAAADPQVRPALEEWRHILDGLGEELEAVLLGEDPRSMRLRQSSPFCGLLTPAERTELLLKYRA